MGGHGGLNILPQKRWNVYRDDNQSRVARDERLQREEEVSRRGKVNRRKLQDRINILKRNETYEDTAKSSFSLSEKNSTDKLRYVGSDETAGNRPEALNLQKRKREKNKHIEKKIYDSSGHINFFLQEEELLKKHELDQQQFFHSVGHFEYNKTNRKQKEIFKNEIVSDFDVVASKKLPVPWYLTERNGKLEQEMIQKNLISFSVKKHDFDEEADKYNEKKSIRHIKFDNVGKLKNKKTLNKKEKKIRKRKNQMEEKKESLKTNSNQEAMQKFRQERIEREKKERLRSLKLLNTKI